MSINETTLKNILRESNSLKKYQPLHWIHWLIILLSLTITFGAWYFVKEQSEDKVKVKFNRQASHLVDLLKDRIQKYEDTLWAGTAAVHSQSHGIDYYEWKRFSNTLKIETKYPGINGIGIIYNIAPKNLESFLEEQRKYRPNFHIHPPHNNKDYWPITYIEPTESNLKAVGLDMAHEKNRYTAALKSRDTGTAQITAPITLVQDAEQTPGFLFYAPFYNTQKPQTVEERQKNFVGLVYAPFVVKNLMAGVLESEKRQLYLKITDKDQVLYNEKENNNSNHKSLYSETFEIDMHGRKWIFFIENKKSFETSNKNHHPLMVLIGGILIDSLLFLIFLLLTSTNKRALKLADTATAEYKKQLNELEKLAKELKRSNAELEHFAFLASHDLQEPLRMIKSFVELLNIEYNNNFDEQAQYYMATVVSASERMHMLIKDLLEYSQVHKNKLKIERTCLNTTCGEVLENLSSTISETNAIITTSNLPTVTTAPAYVSRTIQNIISNALKYKHPDRNPQINISAREEKSEWIILISDNGIGIKKEYLEQIFVLFKRLHNSDEHKGTGIGLSICEKMINRLGGRLWVTSTENIGSEFYFTIPKTKKEL